MNFSLARLNSVTAETLYEAVALGMVAIRISDWATGIAQGLNTVKVRMTNVPVDHEVASKDFTKWLDKTNCSPPGEDAQEALQLNPRHVEALLVSVCASHRKAD